MTLTNKEKGDDYWDRMVAYIESQGEELLNADVSDLKEYLKSKFQEFEELLTLFQKDLDELSHGDIPSEKEEMKQLLKEMKSLELQRQKFETYSFKQICQILPISSSKHLETLLKSKKTEETIAKIILTEEYLIPSMKREIEEVKLEINEKLNISNSPKMDFLAFLEKA